MKLPRDVAVVGAGTMGAGIARVFADAGASVRLCARRESNLEAARARLGETAARVRLTTSAEEALDTAELVIETIVEEAEPKRALLARAEELASPEAILTTNTSSLPLAVLAGVLRRPERFAGLHWFNPPELVEVVEVVGGERTAPATIEVLAGWMDQLGKEPVVVRRDVPGFVANRLGGRLRRKPADSRAAGLRRGDHDDAVRLVANAGSRRDLSEAIGARLPSDRVARTPRSSALSSRVPAATAAADAT